MKPNPNAAAAPSAAKIGVAAGFAAALSLVAPAGLAQEASAAGHFHEKGKMPSQYTIDILNQAREALPFDDTRDFEEASRGLIAAPDSLKIEAEAGGTAWDQDRFDFIRDGKDFDSIHPSLERQANLTTQYGLYEVMDGTYQVRGYELSNLTFIAGDTGWIVFDTQLSKETAAAAFDLVTQELNEKPIVAVIYSHSHADHFGGVPALVDGAAVASDDIQIIAPEGFLEHAASESFT